VPRRDPRLAAQGPRRGPGVSQILVTILFALFLIGTAGFVAAALGPEASPSPRPSALVASVPAPPTTSGPGASDAPDPSATADAGASSGPSASLGPSGTPVPAATPGPPPSGADVMMPIVPVVGFWQQDPGLSRGELVAALEGRSERYDRVLVPAADRDGIAAALGIAVAASVETAEPDAIRRELKDGGLGLLRAADVTPLVNALPLEGKRLFGNDRVATNLDWPLVLPVNAADGAGWDQAKTFTVVAGGDSILDRGTYFHVVKKGKGLDYPFDGGTIEITGRYCCGWYTGLGRYDVPRYRQTGNEGVVRRLMQEADISMINLENPVPDDWSFHLHGTPFSGKPALLEIFTRVGLDWAGLANNHMYDYGPDGIADTLKHLDRFEIAHAGAGMDLDEAREYSVLDAGGGRVAILPCVTITPIVWARAGRAGAMPCQDRQLIPNIERAAQEADAVIVFPSWGPEYTSQPQNSQRQLARAWVEAGADVVVGFGHHMVAGMEEIDETLVFYSIGNFIFDQNWAEITMEGILPEMTFHGGAMVQVEMNPFLTIDQTQPNLLDPAGDGEVVLRRIHGASLGWLRD